jgi:hypothetical protein
MWKTKTNWLLPCTPRLVRILIVTNQLWWTTTRLWSIGYLGKWVKNVVGWSARHVSRGFATTVIMGTSWWTTLLALVASI